METKDSKRSTRKNRDNLVEIRNENGDVTQTYVVEDTNDENTFTIQCYNAINFVASLRAEGKNYEKKKIEFLKENQLSMRDLQEEINDFEEKFEDDPSREMQNGEVFDVSFKKSFLAHYQNNLYYNENDIQQYTMKIKASTRISDTREKAKLEWKKKKLEISKLFHNSLRKSGNTLIWNKKIVEVIGDFAYRDNLTLEYFKKLRSDLNGLLWIIEIPPTFISQKEVYSILMDQFTQRFEDFEFSTLANLLKDKVFHRLLMSGYSSRALVGKFDVLRSIFIEFLRSFNSIICNTVIIFDKLEKIFWENRISKSEFSEIVNDIYYYSKGKVNVVVTNPYMYSSLRMDISDLLTIRFSPLTEEDIGRITNARIHETVKDKTGITLQRNIVTSYISYVLKIELPKTFQHRKVRLIEDIAKMFHILGGNKKEYDKYKNRIKEEGNKIIFSKFNYLQKVVLIAAFFASYYKNCDVLEGRERVLSRQRLLSYYDIWEFSKHFKEQNTKFAGLIKYLDEKKITKEVNNLANLGYFDFVELEDKKSKKVSTNGKNVPEEILIKCKVKKTFCKRLGKKLKFNLDNYKLFH